MTPRITLLCTAAAFALSALPASAGVTSTSPGKNAVAVAEDSALLNQTGDIAQLVGTITRAKSRRILRVEARVNVVGSSVTPGVYAMVYVNGMAPKPSYYSSVHCSTSGTSTECGATAVFWLDIDAAGLVGQPLNITLDGGSTSSGAANLLYVAGFTAEMVKK